MNLEMTFTCDKKWDNMPVVAGGKFCGSCKKEVTDFTHLTNEEIISQLKLNTKACGLFTANQLYSVEEKPKRISYPNKFLAYASALVLLLPAKHAISQPKNPPIEQLQYLATTTDVSFTRIPKLKGDHVCSDNCACTKKAKKRHPYRKRLRLTRRFPFISYRRPPQERFMGAVRFL